MAFVYLPREDIGRYAYGDDSKRYGKPEVLAAVVITCAKMYRKYGLEVGVGNISFEQGGPMPPHTTHQNGDRVDFRPIRKDKQRLPCTYQDEAYSREWTYRLMSELLQAGFQRVLFNDPFYLPERVSYEGHDNHIHAVY